MENQKAEGVVNNIEMLRCLVILNEDLITFATHSQLSEVGDTPFDNHVFWKDNGL